MSVRTRRIIARGCIAICVACVVIAAAAFTFGLGHLTFAGVMLIDVPATISITGARLYLHSTRGQS